MVTIRVGLSDCRDLSHKCARLRIFMYDRQARKVANLIHHVHELVLPTRVADIDLLNLRGTPGSLSIQRCE